MRLYFILLVLVLVGGCASLQTVADVEEAYTLLQDAEYVATARAGYAGELAPETRAFQEILEASDASQRFERLLEQSTLAGQMYALAGLYLTDRDRFDEVAPRYRDDQREVEGFVGDVRGAAPVAAIVGYDPPVGTPGSILDGSWPSALAGENNSP